MRRITVDASLARECTKCKRTEPPFHRHHMGFDSLTGHYNVTILSRYRLFLDCVDLCPDCHATIHFIYEPYVTKWVNRSWKGAANFRKQMIQVCKDWLSGKIPTPAVPVEYLQDFRAGTKAWERDQEWQKNQEK